MSDTAELTITHTAEQGTLIEGTSRGDGTAEILKANRWRWSRNLGSWYVPRSRDTAPQRAKINATTEQLREAGFSVAVEIDDEIRDRAEIEADLEQRAEIRAARLAARADRHAAASDVARDRSDQISERFAGGQPILVDHYSARKAFRDQDRMHSAMRTAIAEDEAARADAAAADVAGRRTQLRNSPVTVGNRIAKLEADIRRTTAQRDRTGFYAPMPWDEAWTPEQTDRHRARFDRELERLTNDLEYWQKVRAEQIETGQATDYSRETVHKGDFVRIRGQWRKVARANAKTVSVETDYSWTDRSPWYEVKDHRTAEQVADAAETTKAAQ